MSDATPPVTCEDHLRRFRQHLIDRHYSDNTVGAYIRCIGALLVMMRAEKIGLGDLDETRALELVTRTGWIEKRRTYAAFMARRFVRFLSEQGVGKPPPPPTAKEIARVDLRRDYEAYLRRQRGLSETTIYHSWRLADRFLEFRFGEEVGDLAQISPADIASFLQHLTTRTPPLRDKTPSSHLRNFFRYLFQAGKTTTDLASGIPSVAQRYGARLPRHLTPEQVDLLLGSVRSDTPRGRRNYAMVLLLARLGLRPPEVVAMQIDDIDWRSGEILVRGKGDRHDRLPLLSDLDAGVLTLRRGKLGKARLLPLSDSTTVRLAAYAKERDRLLGAPSQPFFVSDRGERLTDCGARYNFAAVCQAIGLRPAEKFHRHGRGPAHP